MRNTGKLWAKSINNTEIEELADLSYDIALKLLDTSEFDEELEGFWELWNNEDLDCITEIWDIFYNILPNELADMEDGTDKTYIEIYKKFLATL